MERRHYQRIRRRAIEGAQVDLPPKRQVNVPLVAGGVGVLVLGLFVWFLISKVVPDSESAAEAEAGEGAAAEAGFISGWDIQKLAERFLAADSVEALLETVEHPEESEPRMREFYKDGGKYQLPMGNRVVSVSQQERGGVVHHLFLVDRIFRVATLVPVAVRADGSAKVNWEEAVGWMEKPWEEILAERPAGPIVVKLIAALDDYYNYDFRDESKWQCLRLGDRMLEASCYGYIDRSNPSFEEMKNFGAFVPVTLEIEFAPGGRSGQVQVEIVRFLHIGWADE